VQVRWPKTRSMRARSRYTRHIRRGWRSHRSIRCRRAAPIWRRVAAAPPLSAAGAAAFGFGDEEAAAGVDVLVQPVGVVVAVGHHERPRRERQVIEHRAGDGHLVAVERRADHFL
jgi:hypothetical protein